jgi:adenylate kinase family enzyme
MQRVVILGCSGAGKSTFARALGARLGVPVVHLDALFWEPGWKEPENEAFRARVTAAIAGDAWVSDGNYVSRTFDLRLPRADTVIFLDQPRWLCVFRILWRWLTSFGRTRPDLAEGCEETFDWTFFLWVWNFERKSQPRILAVAGGYPTPITRLLGDAEMARFLAALPAGGAKSGASASN